MSDQLHDAVQAELDQHTPGPQPSFEAILARKRRRDRRRGGAALAATALAVAGVAFVPQALTSGAGSGGPTQVARGSAVTFTFQVSVDGQVAEDDAARMKTCLALPGQSDVMTLFSAPPQYSGTVTGQNEADAFVECIEAVPGRRVALTRQVDTRPPGLQPKQRLSVTFERGTVFDQGFNGRQVDACLRLPGTSDLGVGRSMPPIYTVNVTGSEQLKDVQGCLGKIEGTVVQVDGQAEQSDSAQAIEWTGAQVCIVDGPSQCRALGRDAARSLYVRLEAAAPAPADEGYCRATGTVYSVLFEHPSVKPVPFEVPYPCGPMAVGNEERLLDESDREAVRRAHESGSPDPATAPSAADVAYLTPEQQAFIESCVGSERPAPVAGYLGLDERAAEAKYGPSTRVVGRNGDCLGRTRDLREDRVNLIVDGGDVIWAGRF